MKKMTWGIVLLVAFICSTQSVIADVLLFEKSEYADRRQKLMDKIPDGIAIILGSQLRTDDYELYQNNDFVYLCGVEIPDSILVIDGLRRESTLFFTISERSARNEGLPLELIRKPEEVTGIENIERIEDFTSYLGRLERQTKVVYTRFKPEELMREDAEYKLRILQKTMVNNVLDGRLTRELQFIDMLKRKHPALEIKDCTQFIVEQRIIKSPAEIELLRKAGIIGARAHIELMKSTYVGMKESELAALFEYLVKVEGAQDLAYYAIICSGPNHPYLHYHEYDRVLEDGDIIVIDVGPDFGYYDIDITITYPANGKFTPRQKEIYNASRAVHEANMQVYRPGLTTDQCRKEVAAILEKQGYDLSKEYFKRMRGGFGHFVGMATHDAGGRPQVLKAGMVFANEPLMVLADEEIGVRTEDTILITEDGCENLTPGIPRTVGEIEKLMKEKGIVQVLKEKQMYQKIN
ncbi:aminopeptidase P N-terminal domain-containing protein [Acidobacteriota bacterium]